METVKELLIDAAIVLFGLIVIMAGDIKHSAKGLSCGQSVSSAERIEKAP